MHTINETQWQLLQRIPKAINTLEKARVMLKPLAAKDPDAHIVLLGVNGAVALLGGEAEE